MANALVNNLGVVYVDDTIVGGSTLVEHDFNLRKVLEQLNNMGMHMNPNKMQVA